MRRLRTLAQEAVLIAADLEIHAAALDTAGKPREASQLRSAASEIHGAVWDVRDVARMDAR